MKKILIIRTLVMLSCCLFANCGTKTDNQAQTNEELTNSHSSIVFDAKRCEKMILEHPFFKETYVAVTDKKRPECEEAYAGCVKNGYITLSGPNADAHYYYMYGFGIDNMRDVFIEERKATCIFDLVYAKETIACKYIDDRRIGNKMKCMAYFTKYEDGWKLDGIDVSDPYFTINTWSGSGVIYNVNFNSYTN